MKPVKIYSLAFIPPVMQYVVTLEEIEGTRLIPIWIGPNEGSSMAMVLQGEKFPRPLTYDLMINVFNNLGVKITKIVINNIKNNTYYANISLDYNGKTIELDSRPSDAFNLAVRVKTDLFIEENVLKLCPVINKPITEEEVKKFKEDLNKMRPEDFFKKLEEGDSGKSKFE